MRGLFSFLETLTAFANSLWIKFRSDATQTRNGFKMEYYTEKRSIGTRNNIFHGDDPHWTSRKNSLELIELSSINKVSLV